MTSEDSQTPFHLSVVTRTKNRPRLLRRALESVAAQTVPNSVWVIVNDGGDPAPVDEIAAEASRRGLTLRVIHHGHSLGMEAASNAGLAAADSVFVAIHDDDDTWESEFASKTVAYLLDNPDKGGVVTRTTKVVEKIEVDGSVSLVRTRPFNPELHSVHLSKMAEMNLFPPISFVYRRSVLDLVGGYDISLPVLGDWEFNLRFLSKLDIGVIPQALANYHFRPSQTGSEGNTVGVGIDRHVEWDAVIRNRLIRKDLAAGVVGLGHLVAAGRRNVELDKTLRPMILARTIAKRTYHVLRRIAGAA